MADIHLNYAPREVFLPFHARSERWSCLVAHRRCGKTVACVNDLHERALYNQRPNARYSYIAPFYSQAKAIAWDYLKQATVDTRARPPYEASLTVELFNGSRITLYGADNPDALRGIYNDGVVLDEFGDCRPALWGEVILPTLADRKGWAVFIGTPKGKNHFHKIYQQSIQSEGWFNATLRASETNILDPDELAQMRAQMSEEEYQQEFECSFDAAVRGTYYASLLNQLEQLSQVRSVQWDPDQPVHVASDLGYTDSMAFWFWQDAPDGVAVIDYFEDSSQPLPHYFDMLRRKPYDYGTIWLPHDAKAKSLQTGRSTIEQFLQEGFPVRIQPKLAVQHGIDAARKLLPMCHFDKDKTEQGRDALRAYRRTWDAVRKSFVEQPLHDWSSNGADAFRYMALVARSGSKPAQPERAKPQIVLTSPKFTLEQLHNDNRRPRRARNRI